jgi:hypothetical protein
MLRELHTLAYAFALHDQLAQAGGRGLVCSWVIRRGTTRPLPIIHLTPEDAPVEERLMVFAQRMSDSRFEALAALPDDDGRKVE